ncbi:MAG: dihydroorotate dehydrogenase [Clostridia bacterium]|nr:dihydroorotate dehydrogenase [Clostridia bacterium]
MVDLSVNLAGIKLKNPVIAASGTFGYGQEFAKFYDLDKLGGISFKGTTLDPRKGNPPPRIADCPSGMLNAVGLQNPGLESVVSKELPGMRRVFHNLILANISGFSVDEYVSLARRFDECGEVGIIEVNISCPNVHGGGMAFGSDPAMAAQVVGAVRKVAKKPLFIKLSPNVTDIVPIARACVDAGCDGLSLINTLLGMRIDIAARRPVLANVTGGLSGPAVFPVAVRMVYQVAKAVNVPIIGMGGISSSRDAVEMMLAGATAVEVGTAGLVNPTAHVEIIDGLEPLATKLGVDKISDLTGGAIR